MRYTGPAAILSRFLGHLLNSASAPVTSFSVALVLGPERGWSNWQGGPCPFCGFDGLSTTWVVAGLQCSVTATSDLGEARVCFYRTVALDYFEHGYKYCTVGYMKESAFDLLLLQSLSFLRLGHGPAVAFVWTPVS